MPGALYYAEAFSPLPGRCFRLVAHLGEAGRLARLVAGAQRPLPRRGLRRPPATTGRGQGLCCLASRRVVPTGAQVQVDAAALELELIIDLAFAVVFAVMLPAAPGLGAGRLAPAGRVTPVFAGRHLVCLAADLSLSCRHRPGPPSLLA